MGRIPALRSQLDDHASVNAGDIGGPRLRAVGHGRVLRAPQIARAHQGPRPRGRPLALDHEGQRSKQTPARARIQDDVVAGLAGFADRVDRPPVLTHVEDNNRR